MNWATTILKPMTSQQGYIALVSAIVISALLMTFTFALSFSGFFARFNILNSEYKERSIGLAEACADIALLKLSENSAYTGGENVAVDGDSCHIYTVATVGANFEIYTDANFNSAETNIKVVAAVSDLDIVSWGEIAVWP